MVWCKNSFNGDIPPSLHTIESQREFENLYAWSWCCNNLKFVNHIIFTFETRQMGDRWYRATFLQQYRITIWAPFQMSQFFHLVLNVPSSHTRRPSQMAANGEQYLPFLPVERANLFILKGFALFVTLGHFAISWQGKKIKAKKVHLTVSLSSNFVALWLEFYELGGPLHYRALSQDWQQALPLTKAEVESDDGQK